MWKCLACSFVANTKENLELHKGMKHSFPCNQCAEIFNSEKSLRHHQDTTHKVKADKKFKCNICTYQAEHLLELYEHKFSKHPDIPMEFNPNRRTVKDMILNLIAEQNLELMEELQGFKKEFRLSLTNFL
jgi:hypothetical protein